MTRQLDRLEERTRDLATRADLEVLRKELVARDSLDPQLNSLQYQIKRVDEDRVNDKKALEKRMDDIEAEQLNKQERLRMNISQAVAVAGFALALFQFLSHTRFIP